jgi:hypothetical protein
MSRPLESLRKLPAWVSSPTARWTDSSPFRITAFGTATSKERMIERLNAGADEATAEISLDDIQAEGARTRRRGSADGC